MKEGIFLNPPCLELHSYTGLSTGVLFLKDSIPDFLVVWKKNGKHELERLKKQNTNKKHLKCIKTKNKTRKQMEPAILLHLHVLGSFLLLGKRRYFSRLKINVVLYLQGFQQVAATLWNSPDSSNAHLCCLLYSEYLGRGGRKQAYHL